MDKYTVLGLSIYEHEYTEEENEDRLAEFIDTLRSVGIEAAGPRILVEFVGDWRKDGLGIFWDLNECIDCLAIKDGADFVRFADGTYGVVAYYNGKRDAVKITRNITEDEYEEVYNEL